MRSSDKFRPRKFAYQGDVLTTPPPPELASMLERHQGERDALITVLAEIQRHYGFLARDHLGYVARELGFPLARVYGVATFYNLFLFDPPGDYQLRVCRGTACHVNQSQAILHELSRRLSIQIDETTPDGRFTLQTVACVGACSLAPVLVINDESHGRMTPEAAWQLVAGLAAAQDGATEESATAPHPQEKTP